MRVLIAWEASIPTPAEVLKLRKLLPSLTSMSAKDVLNLAKNSKAWDCGEMEYGTAVDLREKAKDLGLIVYAVDTEPQNR